MTIDQSKSSAIYEIISKNNWSFPSESDYQKLRGLLQDFQLGELLLLIESIKSAGGQQVVILIYSLWIELNTGRSPLLYAAWFNIGVELSVAQDHDNAITAYKNALALKPDLYQAAINLGLRHELTGQADLALETWKAALQPDEARIGLLNHIGRVSEIEKRYDRAIAALDASLLTDPLQPDVIHHWMFLRQKTCRWPVFETCIPHLSVETMRDHVGPLATLALTDDIEAQGRRAAAWLNEKAPPATPRLSPPEGYRHDRIRLGYLSSDYCSHPISYLVAELFERHDRTRFEVFGYCSSRDDGSETRKRIIAGFDKFVPIRDMSDEQAARAIRADEIDVLIDLNGLTLGTRLFILRARPAPVQITWLGYIGSLPLPELDYLLCDDFVIPRESADAYQPAPLYLPDLFQVNDTRLAVGPTPSRAAVGLPVDRFVFCSFSNNYKITEEMFEAWMTILKKTGDSVLWLLADNEWAGRNMQERAARCGIDPARLIFAGRVMAPDYLGRLPLADLFLDTWPYNAGTTASDALRMGLPLITLAGRSYVSRMAGSLLRTIGYEEGIVGSLAAYVEKAIELATDPVKYRKARSAVGGGAWRRTIGNIENFVPQLESLFCSVVKRP